ncbi:MULTISPECIES: H-NS histone family protein [Pseudoalteromonas]|uniref:H-NS histone family protein n=1 Tax=Pseudoalteromonas TaxID=53246 RepID=UPI00029B25DF|nr:MULTISPECIES: H-NS histone family protein [Pseudoalteromonas]AUJ70721.1 DNA-binding protein StpA [Pseudoalteromonas sp. NC201]MBR8845323.1 H-NS histone family protein [Pseudoalteromonas sp. JC3]MCF2825394.1 H-NS histone family protein [Pseudoalteromonas sp. OF5H-5]MCF2833029.1 H-NS histone family protein [Pseudoalteromonas sp. DL2-H6]MCF2923227.1 H-NS histone family protein [Pseudoalteromonas sp. DL2-H1]
MREIKSFIKNASYGDLEKALELIQKALDEQKEQQQAKEEVLAMLKEKGLTLDDLVGTTSADRRSKVKAKYRIEKDGEVIEWTGRGKTPKVFQGVNLDDYLI